MLNGDFAFSLYGIYVYNKHLYAGLVAYGTGGVVGKWYIVGNTIIIYD